MPARLGYMNGMNCKLGEAKGRAESPIFQAKEALKGRGFVCGAVLFGHVWKKLPTLDDD